MAIRNYAEYDYEDVNGGIHPNFSSTVLNGVIIFFKPHSKSAELTRRLCKCGNVDNIGDNKVPCTQCGNVDFVHARSLWSGKHFANLTQYPNLIASNVLYSEDYEVIIDKNFQRLRIKQLHCKLAWTEKTPCTNNWLCVDLLHHHKIDPAMFNIWFQSLVANNTQYKAIQDCIDRQPKNQYGNVVLGINRKSQSSVNIEEASISLYNALQVAPFIYKLEDAVMLSFALELNQIPLKTIRRMRNMDELFEITECPLLFADMLPIIGVPRRLRAIDNLSPELKSAVRYAVMHGQLTINTLQEILTRYGVNQLNDLGGEFAEFFRKNICLYGSQIAFTYGEMKKSGASTVKEDTIILFEDHLRKKKFKEEKIKGWERAISEGDPIAAMQALL